MGIKIQLSQEELEQAVSAFVTTNYNIPTAGKVVTIKFTSSRKGTGGTVADIDIGNVAPVVHKQQSAVKAPTVEEVQPKVEVAESTSPVAEEEVEVVSPTPETAGHETPAKTSLFD